MNIVEPTPMTFYYKTRNQQEPKNSKLFGEYSRLTKISSIRLDMLISESGMGEYKFRDDHERVMALLENPSSATHDIYGRRSAEFGNSRNASTGPTAERKLERPEAKDSIARLIGSRLKTSERAESLSPPAPGPSLDRWGHAQTMQPTRGPSPPRQPQPQPQSQPQPQPQPQSQPQSQPQAQRKIGSVSLAATMPYEKPKTLPARRVNKGMTVLERLKEIKLNRSGAGVGAGAGAGVGAGAGTGAEQGAAALSQGAQHAGYLESVRARLQKRSPLQ
jgi:hypothetical protein